MPLYSDTGLTDFPIADTASPAAKMFRAASVSRSWIVRKQKGEMDLGFELLKQ